MPERLTWEQAAAIPSSFLTSYEAIVRQGELQAGEWLLITGASSGVGGGSILTAQVLGARTIGTSGSAEKLEKLKSIGLDVGICTRSPDFASRVKDATGGKDANLAVNLVGASVFPEIMRALGYEGRVGILDYSRMTTPPSNSREERIPGVKRKGGHGGKRSFPPCRYKVDLRERFFP